MLETAFVLTRLDVEISGLLLEIGLVAGAEDSEFMKLDWLLGTEGL